MDRFGRSFRRRQDVFYNALNNFVVPQICRGNFPKRKQFATQFVPNTLYT